MISINEARQLIAQRVRRLPATNVSIDQVLSRTLAEPIISEIDSPPHDKSLVDGYAVRANDVTPDVRLTVLEEVTAGMLPSCEVTPGTATRIMTGAPIPNGADAVVMIEQTKLTDNVVAIESDIKPGQNVMLQATSIARGATVLDAGRPIRSIEMGLLAEMGVSEVKVEAVPEVAVLATGDELVPIGQAVPAGKIRNSNGPMLSAMVTESRAEATNLGIARDNEASLTDAISRGLKHDVLLLSGGVSAGVLDLVPATLDRLGVRQVFHKVAIRPGKPIWFGELQNGKRSTLVFGLPGNPVSSLVCFHVFVGPALRKMMGQQNGGQKTAFAELSDAYTFHGNRPTFHPSQISDDSNTVEPLKWKGSSDLATLSKANCFVLFDGSKQQYEAGERVEIYPVGSTSGDL